MTNAVKCPKCGTDFVSRTFESTHVELQGEGNDNWVAAKRFGQYSMRYACQICSHEWKLEPSHMDKKRAERMIHVR